MDHESRCAELYRIGNQADPIPDGLLVVGSTACTLCKNSMRNHDYRTQLTDGTPLTWINIDEESVLNRFYTIPGISYDYEQERPLAAGKPMGGTPIYLWVQDGRVAIGPLGAGEQPDGALDAMPTRAAELLKNV